MDPSDCFPDGHFVTFAELRRRVAVQLQDFSEGCAGIRSQRILTRRGRRDFGDRAHSNRVVIPSREQRRARGRAERSRVKAQVLETVVGEPLQVGRRDRSAKRTGRTEADIIDQHDEHVGRALRWTHLRNGWIVRVRVLGVVRGQRNWRDIGNGQNVATEGIGLPSHFLALHDTGFERNNGPAQKPEP